MTEQKPYDYDYVCLTACPPGKFRHGFKGLCREKGLCPDGFYSNSTTMTCVQCHATCETCYDRGPLQCKKCANTPGSDVVVA